MNLQDLKIKEPEELLKQAEKLGIENPSSFRKQDLMFAILKQIALDGELITGLGAIEIMNDGFGFSIWSSTFMNLPATNKTKKIE